MFQAVSIRNQSAEKKRKNTDISNCMAIRSPGINIDKPSISETRHEIFISMIAE
jgi:hypothetical protein